MVDDGNAAPAGGGAAVAGASDAGGGADLGTGADIDVGGGAGGAGGGAGAPKKEGADRLTFKEGLDKVRELVKATKGERDPGHTDGDAVGEGADAGDVDAPAETPEERETRLAALTPEERATAEADEAAALEGDPLVIDLGAAREGEEPIRIQAEDQQMADHIRSLLNRAASYQTSLKVREEAETFRAQADEMQYEVQLDPAGFLLRNLDKSPTKLADATHIAKMLLTRPGVLDSVKEWVVALAATPAALQAEARLANADRIERMEKVKPAVARLKFENQNARQCVRKAYDAVAELAPADWKPEQHDQLVRDVVRDLNDLQQKENVRVTDPRRIAGLVQRRLASFGVAPKGTKAARAGVIPGREGAKTPARTGLSGQELVAADTARRRAAGPGPGAGSPAARMPKPPAGTKLTGKGNVFDFIRGKLPALRRAP